MADEQDINWSALVARYLRTHPVAPPVNTFLETLSSTHPLDVSEALAPELAEAHKKDLVDLFLSAIRQALTDHALTNLEVTSLRQVALLLRIEEGDLLKLRRTEVEELLAWEMEQLLMDQTIDPVEALHKVKLQQLLGLGYDQFVELTAPHVDNVILDLAGDLSSHEKISIERFLNRVGALDTVYNLNPGGTAWPGGGSLYLLINAAMPDLIKVGRTARTIDERMRELSSATGVPMPFVLVYEVSVTNVAAAEEYVHSKLDRMGYRTSSNREFFSAPPKLAIELMQEARTAV